MKPFPSIVSSFALLSLCVATVIANAESDLGREQRLEQEVIAGLFTGEAIKLPIPDGEFLAVDTEPEGDLKGGVVILHGRGFHPDWPEVVAPLRTQLAESGWRTLSLQMPVLDKAAKYYDYVPLFPEAFPRIEAGIAYLRDLGVRPIVLVAHSCGVHMAMAWVRERGEAQIDGFVGIGMGATDYQQPMMEPFPLAQMRAPVLDVYGSNEYPAVLRMAPDRLAAIRRAGNPKSRQLTIAGAEHYFRGQEQALVSAVREWLDSLLAE
jgi:pimeloyl-ACP methyl ester carboxylesterase